MPLTALLHIPNTASFGRKGPLLTAISCREFRRCLFRARNCVVELRNHSTRHRNFLQNSALKTVSIWRPLASIARIAFAMGLIAFVSACAQNPDDGDIDPERQMMALQEVSKSRLAVKGSGVFLTHGISAASKFVAMPKTGGARRTISFSGAMNRLSGPSCRFVPRAECPLAMWPSCPKLLPTAKSS